MSREHTYKGFKVVTGPGSYPLTVNDARAQLNLPGSLGDDDFLTSLIAAATKAVESYTGLSLISQTIQQVHDGFPNGRHAILLRAAPAIAVVSVTYTDTAGDSQTWASDQYDVDTTSIPARLVPKPNINYPSTSTKVASVVVEYTSGFGTTAGAIPADIRHAIKLLVTDYFENRDDQVRALPTATQRLLSTYRVLEHYFQC